jgi:hypothetical protein
MKILYLLQLEGNNNRETGPLKRENSRRMTAAEMKCMRKTAGCI